MRLLLGSIHHEFKIKNSKFIADIFPIENEEIAKERLFEIQKREYNANHHCYAWRYFIGTNEYWRANDNGEPAGTAGKPIYSIISGANITGIIAIVTRYFGGIKLGKGGLIRAYGQVVQEALLSAETIPYLQKQELVVEVPFDLINLVFRLAEQFNAEILKQEYNNNVTIILAMEKKFIDPFNWELFQLSNGKLKGRLLP